MAIVLTKKGAIVDALALASYYGTDFRCAMSCEPEAEQFALKLLALIEKGSSVNSVKEACRVAREAK